MRIYRPLFILLLGALRLPAHAALDVGDPAPDFTVPAALGGKVFSYKLSEQLAKGPVVLYFFPAAFSDGCSIEAHQFAEAIGRYEALGYKFDRWLDIVHMQRAL